MTSGKLPQRTLRRVVDVTNWAIITSDDLLSCGPDQYQNIRRLATRARNEHRDHFVCDQCGYPVYAPREPRTRMPYWRHRKGAPHSCPWWTGDPLSVDAASGKQFGGAQESALHVRIKQLVAELLEADPNTAPNSVIVDRYLAGQSGSRRPDVRAEYLGKKIAFEIQLATTQIPVIDARETFYAREDYHLIWLTWNYLAVEQSNMRTAFEDIFYSHNKNIFSLDDETIRYAKKNQSFAVKAFWEAEGRWNSDLFELSALHYRDSGLPYARAPEPVWHEAFLERWLGITTDTGTPWSARNTLLADLSKKIGIQDADLAEINESDIPALINCLLSLREGRLIGSRQSKLVELVNTFLSSQRRRRYARILRKVIYATKNKHLLEIPSVSAKLEDALQHTQDGPDSYSGRIVLFLFPELFSRPRTAKIFVAPSK